MRILEGVLTAYMGNEVTGGHDVQAARIAAGGARDRPPRPLHGEIIRAGKRLFTIGGGSSRQVFRRVCVKFQEWHVLLGNCY